MKEITDSQTVKKISREVIDFLMNHPNFPQQKITNLKGKFGKKFNYHKVFVSGSFDNSVSTNPKHS